MTDARHGGAPARSAQAAQTVPPGGLTPPWAGPAEPPDGVSPAGPPPAGASQASPRAAGRPRRRGNRWRAAFIVLAGAGILGAAAWALFGGRLLVVRSVSVSGTHLVTPAQVIAAADVPIGTPLASVNAGAVARRVEAIRQVASATVTRHWPDQLSIAVTERVPAIAIRMAGGGYDLVDGTGVIVRWTPGKPAGLPVFRTSLSGAALRGNPGVAAAAAVLRELAHWLATKVVSVTATPVLTGDGNTVVQAQQVTLVLRNGTTVLWGDPGNAAQKNRELQIVLTGPALKNTVRDVDVSAPGTVVTR